MSRARANFWNRDSRILLGGFFLVILLILYVWWPLARDYLAYVEWRGAWWLYLDWLLIGVFFFMSTTIIARASLRTDAIILLVGTCGGLVIEAWGTQTNLWSYYTSERPPLWIIPAWPIASLSIDRITKFLSWLLLQAGTKFESRAVGANSLFPLVYWLVFVTFLMLMLVFVAPTLQQPYTWFSLVLCVALILTPTDHRFAVLTFAAGSLLGYYPELWGTTRQCWTYYTHRTPPLFAVLAHGMAAVAFGGRGWWREALRAHFASCRRGKCGSLPKCKCSAGLTGSAIHEYNI